MKRRVCIIRHGYYPRENHVRRDAEAVRDAGYHVDIICSKLKNEKNSEIVDRINVYRMPISHQRGGPVRYIIEYSAFFILSFVKLALLHLEKKYAIIEVDTMPDFLIFVTLVPKLLGAKTILYMFEAMPELFGKLARVRFAAEVSLLFDLAPDWTTQRLLPLFELSSPEASAMWSARNFSNYIGAPQLIGLTKASFLGLLHRADTPPEQLRVYAEWLTVLALVNQADNAGYPITMMEMRSVLRKAGEKALPSVAHRLAVEMEKARPDEKAARWQNVVGPVFQGIWPLDVELQTAALTFKLVQILRATGEAFPEAADVIIPFIRPDRPGRHSTVYSIAKADDVLFSSSPAKMLNLISAVVGDPPPASVHALQQALTRIQAADPKLADTQRFQKLSRYASP